MALTNQELTDRILAINIVLNNMQTAILNLTNKKQMTAFSLLMQRNLNSLQEEVNLLQTDVDLLKKQS